MNVAAAGSHDVHKTTITTITTMVYAADFHFHELIVV